MMYSCKCGWVGRHNDLGRFGQCPKCGEYDQTQIAEDKEEIAMLERIAEGNRILEEAIIKSGVNGICWGPP